MKKNSVVRRFVSSIVNRRQENSARARAPKGRALRLEALESRELLSVNPLGDDSAYADLACNAVLEPIDLTGIAGAQSSVEESEFILSNAVSGKTWVVTTTVDDGDNEKSLRYAIVNAGDGDTITFDSSLKGKTITLNGNQLEVTKSITIDASDLYDARTNTPGITIDGDGKSRVFYVNNNFNVNGLKVTNGRQQEGGGIYYKSGVGTFVRCSISGNNATSYLYESGGGAYLYSSAKASFVECSISGNTASYYGGGVYIGGEGTFTDCDIIGNSAKYGGGAYVSNGIGIFASCKISENTASYDGGGVVFSNSGSGSFTKCAVSQNDASRDGGGIYNSSSKNIEVTNSSITGNTASNDGGGFVGKGAFNGCEISGNKATGNGGGISGLGTFNNCNISVNETAGSGGGLYISNGTFTNCTIAGNSSSNGVGGAYVSNNGNASFTESIITMNYGGNISGAYTTDSSSLIGENPLFVCAPRFENGVLTNLDDIDLHLASYSPYLDSVDGEYLGAYDFSGERTERPRYNVVTTLDDEFDLSNSSVSLREAVYMSTAGDTIQFKDGLSGAIKLEGELFIDSNVLIDGGNRIVLDGQEQNRVVYANTVNLSNVRIEKGKASYGGGLFVSEAGDATFTNATFSDNSASYGGAVFISKTANVNFVNSIVKGNDSSRAGGGVYIQSGSVSFTSNTSIIENETSGNGGGVYINYGDVSFTANSSVSRNKAEGAGGGVYIYSGESSISADTSVSFTAASISSNKSTGKGGGVYVYSGKASFTANVQISGNESSNAGGGVYIESRGKYHFDDSSISSNSAKESGGGVYIGGDGSIKNCVITENYSSKDGGGIYQDELSEISDCVVSGNKAMGEGGGIFSGRQLYLTNVDVVGNVAEGGEGGGIYGRGWIGSSFVATNCTISRNTSYGSGGGISDHQGPTLTNCLIADNKALSKGSSTTVGGGLSAPGVTLNNCTIVNNVADKAGGISLGGAKSVVSNSIIVLNTSNANTEEIDSGKKPLGYNNLSTFTDWDIQDPSVVNYTYDSRRSLFVNASKGDYHLVFGSQASDVGDNEKIPEGIEFDLEGNHRIVNDIVDLGAYETEPAFTLSNTVLTGIENVSWNIKDFTGKVELAWTSGVETIPLGSFQPQGNYSWDTTKCSNGVGFLIVKTTDVSGREGITQFKRTLINDPSINIIRNAITQNTTLKANQTHLIVGQIKIASGIKVNVEPKAVLKFWNSSLFNLESGAKLNLGDGATLTRAEDDSIAGDTNKDGKNTTAKYSRGYYIGAVDGVTGSDRAVTRYVAEMKSGSITEDEVWRSGCTYRVTSDLTIDNNATLTIEKGAVVKFDQNVALVVNSGSKLKANGTSTEPVVFTSIYDSDFGGDFGTTLKPSGGDWKHVLVYGEAEFNHTILSYGAPSNERGILEVSSGGSIKMDSCVVSHAKYDGIWNWGGEIKVQNTVITDVGMATAPYRGTNTYTNCVFDNVNYAIMYWGSWSGKGEYVNCVFNNASSGWIDAQGSSAYKSNLSFRNNLFFNSSGVGEQTFSAVGSNGNIWADPKFRDPDNLDYRLTVGSPCIDAADGTVAPATDKLGSPRADDPNVENTGVANAQGAFCDIGAFEFIDNAASDYDLKPISIQNAASVTSGAETNVIWTIQNVGAATIVDAWTDAIYLVSANGARTLVKEVKSEATIYPGDSQSFHASVTAPAVADGTYYFEIETNVDRKVFEGANSANNSYVSPSLVAITTSPLTLPLTNVRVAPNEERLYRLEVPAGASYYLVADSEVVGIRIREDFAPTATLYGAKSTSYDGKSYVKINASNKDRVFYVALSSSVETVAKITRETEVVEPPISESPYDLSKLKIELHCPVTRAGRIGEGTVTVTNRGDEAVWAPMCIILTQDGNKLAWTQEELEDGGASSLSAFAYSENGDLGMIKPGEVVEFHFYFLCQTGMNITGQFYKAKPTTVYDHDTESPWHTYEGYSEAMREAAQIFAQRGKFVRNTEELLRLATARRNGEDCVGVSGNVVLVDVGEPVSNRKLTVSWVSIDGEGESFEEYAYAKTDANGYFCFDYLPKLDSVVIRDEFVDEVLIFDLTDGGDRVGLRIIETPRASLSGKISMPNGSVLEGVGVKARSGDSEVCYAETDSLGFYAFNDLHAGEWTISLVGSGVYEQVSSQTVVLKQQPASLNFTVQRGYNVSGVVVDSEGIGVANLLVQLSGADNNGFIAYTEGNGTFSLENIPSGTYSVAIYDELNRLLRVTKLTVDSDDVVKTLALEANDSLTLSGRVVGANGVSLPGLTVLLYANGIVSSTKVGSNGEYRFDNLGDGSYVLRIAGGNEDYPIELASQNSITNFDIILPYKALLSGSILDSSGTPINDAVVYIGSDADVQSIQVDQNGRFLGLLKEPGSYSIWSASSKGVSTKETISVRAGNNTWTPRMGAGVAKVAIYGAEISTNETLSWNLWVKSNGQIDEIVLSDEQASLDNFELTGLADGEYFLSSRCGSYHADQTFVISRGSTADVSLNFEQSTEQRVSVTLKASAGFDGDFSNAIALVYDAQMKLVSECSSFDENGNGQFAFEYPGAYKIVVLCGQFLSETSVNVSSSSDQLELPLQVGKNVIQGKVKLEGLAGDSVCAYATDENGMIIGFGYTDENGEFIFAVLKTGACTLHFFANDAEDQSISAIIQEGNNVIADVELVAKEDVLAIIDALKEAEILQIADDDETIVDLSNYYVWMPGSPDYEEMLTILNPILERLQNLPNGNICCECNEKIVQQYEADKNKANSSVDGIKNILSQIQSYESEQKLLTGDITATIGSYILTIANPAGWAWRCVKVGLQIYQLVRAIQEYNGTLKETISLLGNGGAAGTVQDIAELAIDAGVAKNFFYDLLTGAKETLIKLADFFVDIIQNPTARAFEELPNRLKAAVDEFVALREKGESFKTIKLRSSFGSDANAIFTTNKLNKLIAARKAVMSCVSKILGTIFIVWDVQDLINNCRQLNKDIDEHTNLIVMSSYEINKLNIDVFELTTLASRIDCPCITCECESKVCQNEVSNNHNEPCNCEAGSHTGDALQDPPQSTDPNELIGPIGSDCTLVNVGTEEEPYLVIEGQNWTNGEDGKFTIYFENKSDATAAAQEIYVTTTLPEEYDAKSLELGAITIGGEHYTLSDANRLADGVWLVDQASTGEKVKITYNYDRETREMKWYLRSYVASTPDHFPASAYDGFLPPNKEKGAGEGYVSFTVGLADGITTGTQIRNDATIVFDTNEPITTNQWFNTIDVDNPTLASVARSYNAGTRTFTVSWSGQDADSGVDHYDVYYSADGGKSYNVWLTNTTELAGDYTVPGASSGDYVFKAVVYDGAGNSAEGVTAQYTVEALATTPGKPENLKVSNYVSSHRQPSLSWRAPSDGGAADRYNIYLMVDGAAQKLAETTETSYRELASVVALNDNAKYTFAVSAVNEYGESDYAYVTLDTTLKSTAPTAPSAFQLAHDEAANELNFTWTDNSDNETKFVVQMATSTGDWSPVVTVAANTTSAALSLANYESGAYSFRVAATNNGGTTYSNAQSFTYVKPGPNPPDDQTVPNAPSDLVFGDYDPETKSLPMSWTDNSDNETSFVAQFSYDGTTWNRAGTTDANVTSRVATSVMADRTYYFRVAAVNDAGYSDWVVNTFRYDSSPSETAPLAPSEFQLAYDQANNKLNFTWTDNSDNETGFTVEMQSSTGTWTSETTVGANKTSASLSLASYADGDYAFRVVAYNSAGKSDSNVASFHYVAPPTVQPRPEKPDGLAFSYDESTDTLTVAWSDKATNEQGYIIHFYGENGSFSGQVKTSANATSCALDVSAIESGAIYVTVGAFNEGGKSELLRGSYDYIAPVRAPKAPSAPRFNYDFERQALKLAWLDLSTSEDGYRVEVSQDGANWSTVATVNPDALAATVPLADAPQGTLYYRVVAFNSVGESASEIRTFETGPFTPLSNLVVEEGEAFTLSVAAAPDAVVLWDFGDGVWREASPNYLVDPNEYAFAPGTSVLKCRTIESSALSNALFSDAPLATAGVVETLYSIELNVRETTPSITAESIALDNDRAAIYRVDANFAGRIAARDWRIDWGDGTSTVCAGQYSFVAAHVYDVPTPESERNITITLLNASGADQFTARLVDGAAVAGANEPSVSNESLASLPSAPSELTFSSYSAENRSVVMTWRDNSTNETGFKVEYSVDGGATWRNSAYLGANVATRTATGLVPGRSYEFRVAARNEFGLSDWTYGGFIVPDAFDSSATLDEEDALLTGCDAILDDAFAELFEDELIELL